MSRDIIWPFLYENSSHETKPKMSRLTGGLGVYKNITNYHMGKEGGLKSAKKVARII